MTPLCWRRIFGELLSLREHLRLQDQNSNLEREAQHLRELANDAQVIVQEQYDKVEAWKTKHSNLAKFTNNIV